MNWNEQAERIMTERFGGGKDNIIPLATVENGNIITYARSNKMRHIQTSPTVALAGDWFTAHAKGKSLGWFCDEKNRPLAEKMKKAFASWIGNGHQDFSDENTIILRLELTDAVLLSHGARYELSLGVF